VFKDIMPASISGKSVEAEIAALVYKKGPILKLVSRYIKRQLQVVQVGVDIQETAIIGAAT
jgi:hypothetical protein